MPMSRKLSLTVSVTPTQVEWLDEKDEANSKIMRELIEEARTND